MFDRIQPAPPDPILGLTDAYRADPRPCKVNLGVGVFMDDTGTTPVLDAVRKAEHLLAATEKTKSYLPISGDPAILRLVGDLVFGGDFAPLRDGRIAAAQALGGTGALRLGFALAKQLRPDATVWLPAPTWGNHGAIVRDVGLAQNTYPWYDPATRSVSPTPLLAALDAIPSTDIVLLHACCHNPTGADPDTALWAQIAAIAEKRGWFPFFDFAYQGFGQNPVDDRTGLLSVLSRVPEALTATSFSKNMGLYSERAGSLQILARTSADAQAALTHVRRIARVLYSNPPRHGAAIAGTILADTELRALWLRELAAMQARIAGNRKLLADGLAARCPDRDFTYIVRQNGMFSYSGLTEDQVAWLRTERSIYMVKGGRINVAGLLPANLPYVCDSIAESLARFP